jgi:hypothetical protein
MDKVMGLAIEDSFDAWLNRANFLINFAILPWKLTENSKMWVHLLATLITLPWFIITLPITFCLCIPAILCVMMGIRHIGR